jgi:hypothetical protein
VPDPRWEVGSEFHWDDGVLVDACGAAEEWLPAPHVLFASGSGALTTLLRQVRPVRLHVPTYFCMGVVASLAAHADLGWYRELPDGTGPHLDTLDARPGDAVLVNNLFGRGYREPWDTWSADHPQVTVIEDHTHDPLSDWARASTAAYCVASLRKTLPVPDGALLWSPRSEPLPAPAGSGDDPAASLKLTAMVLKAAWLSGRDVDKPAFRALQQAGELGLRDCAAPASAFTRAVLPRLDVWRLRSVRAENARALVKSLEPGWHPLDHGPPDAVPFNVQLVCGSEAARDALLAHLARERIFAPVHWRQPATELWSGDADAADYASRILTVPVDHRYSTADVQRVAEVLDRHNFPEVVVSGRP